MSGPRIRRSGRARRVAARRAALRAAMGLLVATVVLAAVELALWAGGVEAAFSGDSIAGWRMTAELSGRQMPNKGVPFTVTTNQAGLRTDLPRARRPGVRRVALMGDSTVFGWGVDDGGTVAEGLAAALAAEHPELGEVEVLNAGQPGYSTWQAAWLFDEVVSEWKPDLTVVFLPQHDLNLVLVSDREQLDGGRGLGATTRVLLARHSRIYNLLRGVLFRQAGEVSVLPMSHDDGEARVPRVSSAERAEAVRWMQETAASWGGEVALGLLPFRGDLTHRRVQPRDTSRWAAAVAPALGVGIVDVRGCCGPDGAHLVLPNDPGHLTAEGNHAVGAAMAASVAGLLQR